MRRTVRRSLAVTAAAALALTACGDDAGDEQAADEGAEQDLEGEDPEGDDLDDLMGDEDMEDPNDDVEDGVYRGSGVVLPVPDGWAMEPMAFQQGIVAAVSDDQQQQMSARAIDAAEAGGGEEMELDTLVETVLEQLGEEPEIEEEVELEGADRAQRLTFTDLPSPEEGMPDSSATIVLAESGDLIGEFTFAAPSDAYDEELADLLVTEAGFDPDSEPPEMPEMQPQPAPEGGEGEMSEEDLEELMEQMEEQEQQGQ